MVAVLAALPAVAAAQDAAAGAGGPRLGALGARQPSDSTRPRWLRPVASALVPGSGQILAGNERGALYLVAEAFLLTRLISQERSGLHSGDQFRDLALQVARGPFKPTTRDTVFEYFEQMGRYLESGPFDQDPGPALSPTTDPRTYNGSIWALARRTFFANPDSTPSIDSDAYQRALEFYRRRAIGPGFQWSWRNAGLEQDLFRQTIAASDNAFRAAQQDLGLLLANHLLSAIDAIVTERLSRSGHPVDVSSTLWPAGSSGVPEVRLSLRIGL